MKNLACLTQIKRSLNRTLASGSLSQEQTMLLLDSTNRIISLIQEHILTFVDLKNIGIALLCDAVVYLHAAEAVIHQIQEQKYDTREEIGHIVSGIQATERQLADFQRQLTDFQQGVRVI